MALRLEGLSVTNPNGLNAGASSSPFSPSAVPLPSSLLPAATVACPRLGPPPHRSLLRPTAEPPPPLLEEAAGMERRRKGPVVEEGLAQGQGQQRDMAGGGSRCEFPAMVVQCSALVLGSRRMNCGPEGSEAIGWTGWRRATWPVDWRGAASSLVVSSCGCGCGCGLWMRACATFVFC